MVPTATEAPHRRPFDAFGALHIVCNKPGVFTPDRLPQAVLPPA